MRSVAVHLPHCRQAIVRTMAVDDGARCEADEARPLLLALGDSITQGMNAHHPALAHHFDNLAQQKEAATLGMWVFLVTEVLFFGGLFAAYSIYRGWYPDAFAAASHTLDITFGTVNTAEFFLTVTISATFIFALGWEAFTTATLGLLIGGVLAAPFGAIIAKRVNPDRLLTFVGALVTLTSGYALVKAITS